MKQFTFIMLTCIAATSVRSQPTSNEKAVMAYYAGFEKHDLNAAIAAFADGFTFTSPNNDDHISIDKFKTKCWPSNQFFKSVRYVKWGEGKNGLFALVEITTTAGKIIRNTDFYQFDDAGKIKSIEVFFGPGDWFPGNKN